MRTYVDSTGIKSQQGLISYPLVELLVQRPEMCNACESCGLFESQAEGEVDSTRFKRCARCKLVYYVRPVLSFDLWLLIVYSL